MINFAFNISSLLGLFDLILALATVGMSLSLILRRQGTQQNNRIVFEIVQLLIVPFSLLFSGAIFIFQGWRLDPILQLALLSLHSIIIFLLIKDFYLYRGRL
jgi:ABC-type transport system involved in cytochrome c biogenesis permease subunit